VTVRSFILYNESRLVADDDPRITVLTLLTDEQRATWISIHAHARRRR
jgi:hypothetical protein